MEEEGFGIIYSFTLILFISALILVTAFFFRTTSNLSYKKNFFEQEIKTQKIANTIIQNILKDETPDSNYLMDLVRDSITILEEENSASITLIDVSSRINPNYFRNEIIDETNISKLIFKDGHTMSELEQYRLDNGIGNNLINTYPDFFSEEGLDKYLTFYSFLNLNVADEIAISELYKNRIGKSFGAETFRQKIQQTRMNNIILYNDKLRTFAGPEFKNIYPFMNAVPLLNIHFISEKILKEILSHSFGSSPLPKPDKALNTIIQNRENREFTAKDLEAIFSINELEHPIYDYLGVKTWFWEINIETSESKRVLVVAELPIPEKTYRPGLLPHE